MKKIVKNILLIISMILIVLSTNLFQKIYASSETDELIQMLDEMKSEFGNMKQFKEVVDETYNDLNSATSVDNQLKAKLKADIEKLSEVEGINPMLSTMLIGELNGQVESLTDETLPQMKEEIGAIKEWADANQNDGGEEPPTSEPPSEQEKPTTPEKPKDPENPPTPEKPSDPSTSDKHFPNAGIRNIASIVILITIIVFAILSKMKYKNLKDI